MKLKKGISTLYRMDRGSLVQPVDCREHSDLNGLKCYRGVWGGAVQAMTEKMTKVNEFGTV